MLLACDSYLFGYETGERSHMLEVLVHRVRIWARCVPASTNL